MDGTLLRRTWTPTNTDSVEFQEKLVIYDSGDFIGFLIERADGSTEWQGAFLQDRDDLEETLCIANEFYTPKSYFQIEEFPLFRRQSGELLIPGWQLQQQLLIPGLQQTIPSRSQMLLMSRESLPQRDQPALRKDQPPQRAPGAVPRGQPLQPASPPPSSTQKQHHQGSRAPRQARQPPTSKSSSNTVATSSC